MNVSKARIDKNLQRIRRNIEDACRRAGRSPREISIVAVTKTVDNETIRNLLDCGLTQLGESRAQQLAERAAALGEYVSRYRPAMAEGLRWHMVGHLQRNKVKAVLEVCDIIHSVDSLRLAEEIDTRAEQAGMTVDVLLQVNCSQEPQKFGVAVGAAMHLAELIVTLKNLRLAGLMTIAPLVKNPALARPGFAMLSELFEEVRGEKVGGPDFRHLSMGMSNDYIVAVEEGSTMLRLGTALFE